MKADRFQSTKERLTIPTYVMGVFQLSDTYKAHNMKLLLLAFDLASGLVLGQPKKM
ncbi:hypothetical protein U9M48_040184 [Paspalum notatum var. saurae]|uniref:Uncharacterized protein n=1 Tax=Paspalum notatum var. saurae TaxID=547442 RepID=A0AAQ3UKH7_PASNO